MWPFEKKAEDVQTFEKRLLKVEKQQKEFEAELLDVAHSQEILRDKVLRKIQERRKKADEEEEDDMHGLLPSKELNSSRLGL